MTSIDEYMLERVKEFLDTSTAEMTMPINATSLDLDEPRYSSWSDPSQRCLEAMADLLDTDIFPLKGQLEATEAAAAGVTPATTTSTTTKPKTPTVTSPESTVHDVPKERGEDLQHLPTSRKKMRLFLRTHIPMDVWEGDDGSLTVECSLPGIAKDEISLSIDPDTNVLGLEIGCATGTGVSCATSTTSASTSTTTGTPKRKMLLSERQHPSHRLKRFLHLPKGVCSNETPKTSLKDGVLSIQFRQRKGFTAGTTSSQDESWIRKKMIAL